MSAMERVLTSDGSETFLSHVTGETYHSRSGAAREARGKFCGPCGIEGLALQGGAVILDICFGLGYKTAAAIDICMEANPSAQVRVYAFESDPHILAMTGAVDPPFHSYGLVRRAASGVSCAREGGAGITLLRGDAREEILRIDEMADAVFFDPFSPARAPHMWTTEFFRDIRARMRPGARLATYSCARAARDSLRAAGFEVMDGPSVGRRAPSTLAFNP